MRSAARLALAVLALAAGLGRAQPALSDQTFTRPASGLTATLPVGASMSSYEIAGRGATSITLPGMAAIVNVSDVHLTEAQTLREVADTIIRQRLASVSELRVDPNLPGLNQLDERNARGRLLERETREIGGWPCEQFYLQVAGLGGEDSAFGYAVFLPSENIVAMLELQATAADLARAKPYFEMIVNSVAIADPAVAGAERALGVEAGVAFFRSLTPADYEAVIDRHGDDWRFERLFIPGADGSDREAAELGYRRTKFLRGTRGDLKAGDERGRVTPEDRQKGYLVFQEARILDAERDVVIDIAARFFVRDDRTGEGWSIRQSVRPWRGRATPPSNMVETGVRERSDMTIARSENGKPVSSSQPAIEGTGYISRAETYLLPHLLMHKDAPGSYRCYALNPMRGLVSLREDRLERDPDHAGAWKHVSRPAEDTQPQTTYFTAKGELVRSELPDGKIWEPIKLERLFKLWSSKGLPLD